MIALEELNAQPPARFAASLGAIFEHSPWVPERAAGSRPFASRLGLLEALRQVVRSASVAEQVALIRAHPTLGTQGLARAALTPASASEQRGAGLQTCTPEDLEELARLNEAYAQRFAMPFILAVRGHAPASILQSMRHRLERSAAQEHGTALEQIGMIAGYRLAEAVASPAADDILAMHERLLDARDFTERRALVREWMLCAGLTVFADDMGVLGRRAADGALPGAPGASPGAPRVLAGSEGAAPGLLIALGVVQRLRQESVALAIELLLWWGPAEAAVAAVRTHLGAAAQGRFLAGRPAPAWLAADGAGADRAVLEHEVRVLREFWRALPLPG